MKTGMTLTVVPMAGNSILLAISIAAIESVSRVQPPSSCFKWIFLQLAPLKHEPGNWETVYTVNFLDVSIIFNVGLLIYFTVIFKAM